MVEKTKKGKLSTLETQELIYKKYLQDRKIRHGMSFEELIEMANDPRKYARRPITKKEADEP
jgi:hypothetical protein